MRELQRLPEPQILIDKKTTWTAKFLNSGKNRPDNSKYAHHTIKTQLNSISHNKCFYCETQLKGKRKEVDHHIEVSIQKELAYAWENLYLACDNCNNKINHNTIPIYDALNPCKDSDSKIKEHLTFEDELIEPKNNSDLGLRTIKKYRLDNELLDNRRLKSLKKFLKLIYFIRQNQVLESRDYISSEEKTAIHKFRNINNSYSLMFDVLIEKYEL